MTTTSESIPTSSDRGAEGNPALRGAPCLCVAFEAERPLQAPSRHVLAGVEVVSLGRGHHHERSVERLLDRSERELAVRVPDRWMSSQHAWLRRIVGRWVLEDAGSKNGTFLNGKPAHRAELNDGDVIELGHTFFVFRGFEAVEGEQPPLDEVAADPREPGLSTLRASLQVQLRALERLAPTAVSVILRGESGTGKEVVARALHHLSGRPGVLQAVNCGALPDTLVESELFGYRKGAFSGAFEDRLGLVRSADHGTLFLDEIGDLPMPLQASLLRVLQESEVLPVGATRPVKVDLRVVVASHRDLDAMALRGDFRADLLGRLAGFTLSLPPLRERREDLGLLTAALLRKHLGERAPSVTFGGPAARALFHHRWPLNVRELEKCLTVASALASDGRIELEHLPATVRAARDGPVVTPDQPAPRALSPAEEKRRDELLSLLRQNQGNVSAVARALGKARMQVQRWMKRFGIDPTHFRG